MAGSTDSLLGLEGKRAFIAGGGQGIGESCALLLARAGCDVAVLDCVAERAEAVAKQVEARGAKETHAVIDVADRERVHAWAEQVIGSHGRANLVVNNAGVGLGATIEDMSYEDFDWLLGVNLHGVVHGTKAFLPHLIASGDGHVVNVSSVFGIIGVPTQSTYCATKFAVRGFTESLAAELSGTRPSRWS